MNTNNPDFSDQKAEMTIANILRLGVAAAAVIVLFGGILYLSFYGNFTPDYSTFKGQPLQLRQPHTIVRDALHFRRRATIELGLLLLIITPVSRVVFAAFSFWRQRDYTYVCICLIVLAILTYSLTSGYWKP